MTQLEEQSLSSLNLVSQRSLSLWLQHSLQFSRHLVCFRLSITFRFGLAEDAAAPADLALAAAVAIPAEGAPSSGQPPANHVKQAES